MAMLSSKVILLLIVATLEVVYLYFWIWYTLLTRAVCVQKYFYQDFIGTKPSFILPLKLRKYHIATILVQMHSSILEIFERSDFDGEYLVGEPEAISRKRIQLKEKIAALKRAESELMGLNKRTKGGKKKGLKTLIEYICVYITIYI